MLTSTPTQTRTSTRTRNRLTRVGQDWFPAERYADMTKTLFLSLFWAGLYPQGMFITSATFLISYILDKYSLLRAWRTPSPFDADLAHKTRGHVALGTWRWLPGVVSGVVHGVG